MLPRTELTAYQAAINLPLLSNIVAFVLETAETPFAQRKAMCNYAFHYDDSAFNSGDRVLLIIQRYDMEKKQIYGKIVAKV